MLGLIQWLFGSFWRWAGFTSWLTIVAQTVSLAFTGSLLCIQRLIRRG